MQWVMWLFHARSTNQLILIMCFPGLGRNSRAGKSKSINVYRNSLLFTRCKMPKFTNVCKNPLHEEWNENNDDSKCIHLRAYGLSEVLNVYKRLKIDHCGDQSRYISHSCCYCLSVCLKKEEFTRHLSSDLQISLKEKVSRCS